MDRAKVITVGSKSYRPLFGEHLTPEDIEKARVELNETESNRETILKEVKERFLNDMSHKFEIDDELLMAFLRTRKFNSERTLKLLKNYIKVREEFPAFFPKATSIEKALRSNIINFLPHRDDQGRAIHVCKAGLWNPDEISFDDLVGITTNICEFVICDPVTQVNGWVCLWDASGLTLKQFINLSSPKRFLAFIRMTQDHAPGRLKACYIINCHKLVITIFNLIRYFLKDKLRKRMNFLSSHLTELHAYLDPAILPIEFGGVQPTLDCNELVDKVLKMECHVKQIRNATPEEN